MTWWQCFKAVWKGGDSYDYFGGWAGCKALFDKAGDPTEPYPTILPEIQYTVEMLMFEGHHSYYQGQLKFLLDHKEKTSW